MPYVLTDQAWFVPAAGAGRIERPYINYLREYELAPEINVQWQYSAYPTEPIAASEGCLRVGTGTLFTPATGLPPVVSPSKLNLCYATWLWHSCTDGDRITIGGQLDVGTVFSRHLAGYIPPGITADGASTWQWNTAEAWVKMRVSSIATISSVYFVLNDRTGANTGLNAPPVDWLAGLPLLANTWTVLKAYKVLGWSGWDIDNLRATLSVLGAFLPGGAGPITVDVEWFAFRLSNDALP